jgi:hypothetical protein
MIIRYFAMALLLAACNSERLDRLAAEEAVASANNMSEEALLEIDPNYFQGRSRMVSRGDEEQEALVPKQIRQLIRNGEYRFQVDDLDSARAGIHRMLLATGGHVQGEELSDWRDRMALVMRVRVPSARFEAGTHALLSLGRLEHQMVTVRDVTSEWVDLEARLKAKQVLEGRYLELIARSTKVSELLEMERELGNVRAEIESMQAQRRQLGDQVAMSTITITCIGPAGEDRGFIASASMAMGRGASFFNSFLLTLLEVWPFLLIILLALLGMRRRQQTLRARASRADTSS